jgi:hypothetical protein
MAASFGRFVDAHFFDDPAVAAYFFACVDG